jgi:hypothetical protein
MLAWADARKTVGGRYLDGHPMLLPGVADAWAGRVRLGQELAVMAAP